MSKSMVITLPPELAAILEKVTTFRRGKAGPKMMATVARSVLEVALERELAMVEGRQVEGQVFYDAGRHAEMAEAVDHEVEAEERGLNDRLRALDLLPRRDFGTGSLDLPFKRIWDAYVENFDSPEEALDSFEAELAEAAKRVGHEIENPRGFFVATKREE